MPARDAMTPKERWLAAIHMRPVDRLPFWPKLGGSYPPAQVTPFRNMTVDATHAWIGSDRHNWVSPAVGEVRTRTRTETRRENGVQRTTYEALGRRTELVQSFDPMSQSWHPMRFPVQSLDDIRLMTAFYEDARAEVDSAALVKVGEQVRAAGPSALMATCAGESPLMYWVEWLAGVEAAHYLLSDYPTDVEALFAAMHALLKRRVELTVASSPADAIYLNENTSTTLISPEQYRRYCLPAIREYAGIAAAGGRPMILHMCGHLKALLPDLATLPVRAFEAFTSPTLGNTTLLDGRTPCPNTCLVGGTNAMLWTRPAAEIISRIERDLAPLPHHRGLVITSAGVMPPRCAPDTIQAVCEWVKTYPARM